MVDSIDNLPKIEIAMILTNSESQVEKFAAMYKSLQPQEEFLSFIPPNFDLLQDIRNQGEIVISNRNSSASYNNGNSNGASVSSQAQNIARRPIVRQMSTSGNGSGQWSESSSPDNLPNSSQQQNIGIVTPTIPTTINNSNNSSSFVVSNKSYASIVKPPTTTSIIIGQCVLGSQNHVSVKPALSPSKKYFFK